MFPTHERRPLHSFLVLGLWFLASWILAGSAGASDSQASSVQDLKALAFEDLLDVEVLSVSKRSQPLSRSPAAVTVLTGDEIRRSGHTRIPEALRMVPGMEVARINANTWAISCRGLNDQFASKLLVMIDGRTVYTPLFAGVYWDVQDVMIEDIDRIEVIRGPGGTVWGANAVNGVVNVITKSAKKTHDLLATGGGGSLERGFGALRYGGQYGDLHYRVYGKAFKHGSFDRTHYGGDAGDDWWLAHGGFRMDWEREERHQATLQGDYYDGEADMDSALGDPTSSDLRGLNVLGRYTYTAEDRSTSTAQAYYDRTERDSFGVDEERNILDIELQHDRYLLETLQATVGLSYRLNDDHVHASADAVVRFEPERATDNLVTGFIQLELSLLEDRLMLSAGTKLEYNEYTDFEYQPSARFSWQPDARLTVWGAISRAVRTPSRADYHLQVDTPVGPTTQLSFRGSNDVDAEELLAYELGLRGSVASTVSYDLAAFYFDYDNLLTSEPQDPIITPFPFFMEIPVLTDNQLAGRAYGGELQVQWQVFDIWRLTAAYSLIKLDLHVEDSSRDESATEAEKNTPTHQAQLRSLLNLPHGFEVDAAVYYVGSVSNQRDPDGRKIGDYWRGDLRLGWVYQDRYELSVVGQNLFGRRHPEFGGVSITSSYVPRSVYARATIRY